MVPPGKKTQLVLEASSSHPNSASIPTRPPSNSGADDHGFASRALTWQPDIVARETTEPWVQLATRVPKRLHRALKLQCVRTDTSVMAFVVAAVKEKLARDSSRPRGARNGRSD